MVIKNGEWNIILIFLQWSAAISEGKVARASKDQKGHTCSTLHEPAEKEM